MANIGLPAGRDYGTELSKTLSAQAGIMPNLFGTQAQWQGLQDSTQLQKMNDMMLGTDPMNYQTRSFSPAIYRQGGQYSYGAVPKGVNGLINYPSLPDRRTTGGGGGSGNWWNNLPPGVPPIPGISGGGGGGFNLKRNGMGYATGIDGGVMPGRNGMEGVPTKGSITSNSYPGSIGSYNGMPLPPSPLGPLDPLSFLFGGGDNKPTRRLITPSGYSTQNNFQPGQQGILGLYENSIAPTLERTTEAMSSSQRASDIADVGNYGPAAMQAIRGFDPASAGMLDTATDQASHELQMGSNLTPAQLRQATQAVRARSTGMLGSTGSAGDLGEAMGIGAYGQQLQANRRGYAGNVLGQRQSFFGDPFSRVLGRPGAGLGSSAQALQQGMGLSGSGGPLGLLNPESGYAGGIYNDNYSALLNAAFGNAANQNALIGSGISALGSLAGAGMGAMI